MCDTSFVDHVPAANFKQPRPIGPRPSGYFAHRKKDRQKERMLVTRCVGIFQWFMSQERPMKIGSVLYHGLCIP